MGDTHIDRPDQPMPLSARDRRQRLRRLVLRGAVGALVLLMLGFIVRVPRIVWANGHVISEEYAEIRPAVAGTVSKILAHSGNTVNAGDLLVLLDQTETLAALEEAKREAHKADAEVVKKETEIAETKQRLKEDTAVAELRLQNALSRLQRTRELAEHGLVAGSAVEDEQLKADLAKADLDSLRNRDLSLFDKEIAVARAAAAARHEAVARAEAAVRAREIRAPIAGQVLRYEFVPGELVRPEMVLMEIFGGKRKLLKLRIPERHAVRVKEGNRCRTRLTAYRGIRDIWFDGKVEHLRNVIQADNQAAAHRIAYCSFDTQGRDIPPGATAEAKIYCGKTPFWFFLFGVH